ncbi:MAG: DNA polymerase II [Gammaproteobacteria bacterium]|jgi:DNA polymerase-2
MSKQTSSSTAASLLSGFVLSRQRREKAGQQELVYWASTPQGPLRIVVEDQESVCFVAAVDLPAARQILSRRSGWRYSMPELRDFCREPVAALHFKSQRGLYEARDLLGARGLTILEGDINPLDRYLMERFITGGFELTGPVTPGDGYSEVVNPRLRPAHYRPALRCVSLDIETAYSGDQLYSIGLVAERERLVLMLGDSGQPDAEPSGSLVFYPDEKSLLLAFFDWIRDYDPDVLIGWNVVNFDLRFLQQVCDRVALRLRLGRGEEEVTWRKARDSNDRFFATVAGRVVLDGIELMRSATYSFENFSLDHVARKLLDRGKLVDDVDQRGEEISRLFEQDKAALAAYNLEDCKLVWDIFAQEQLIDFAIARSQLTGLELNRYGGSVAAFDYLYLPRLHRAGFVAPALGQNLSDTFSPGGYVMDSIPGIYRHVIVLDFKSLYPSIIRTFHVDPLALVEGEAESDPIQGFDGGMFSRRHHLLPELIETLWRARDRAKATGNKVLSQAIKIIMNSFYGVLGTRGCRFFDPRLVSSITRRGHQIIKESKDFIEQAGYQVIYGDTDSVFVLIGEAGGAQGEGVESLGQSLAAGLNRWWTEKLHEEQRLQSCLEIEFETHFDRFLMPTIRGAETGSKKRYAGLVRTGVGEDDYRLVFKGLETVRSDWSPLARRFQQELYERIFLDRPFGAFIKQTVQAIQDGDFADELVLRRRLRRKLKDYLKNVPPHVQAARKAEAIRAERHLPSLYEQGGWVEYLMTVNGPEPRQYQQSPIDYEFYIERQITPIADSILVFKSTSMKELLDKQIELFR